MIACVLFSLGLLLQTKKNGLVKGLYNYPPKIQERVKSMEEYQDQILTGNDKKTAKLFGAAMFIIVGVILARLANVTGFFGAFVHMFILFTVVSLYDLIVIDWLIFCHTSVFRIPGTEDMVDEYHNYSFHVVGFLRGVVITVIVSVIVGGIYTVIF